MKCPSCGVEGRLYRSHSRGRFEGMIKGLTPLKTFRCHDCNWRGWVLQTAGGKMLKIGIATGKFLPIFIAVVLGIAISIILLATVLQPPKLK